MSSYIQQGVCPRLAAPGRAGPVDGLGGEACPGGCRSSRGSTLDTDEVDDSCAVNLPQRLIELGPALLTTTTSAATRVSASVGRAICRMCGGCRL